MTDPGLTALLDPASIAVIGASDDPDKIGGRLLRFLSDYGFAGKVLPVNPTRDTVQGLPALRAADQLPEGVDLAVVVTAAGAAPDAVAACARRGVRACVVLSSGFAELGGDGERVQREMVATARAHGMRLLGPNCQGVANLASGAVTSFSSTFTNFPLRDGAVAIVSQSGAVAGMLAALQHPHATGLRYWVATGNEADVTVAELIDAVLDDPGVRVVQAYGEHLADAPRLAAAAEKARRSGKAVLMVKAGATEAGAKAAGSHTGALAQPEVVVEAFLRRHGVVRARSLGELSELSRVFGTSVPVRGNRLAIVSNSGGLGVMMADAAVAGGLELAELTEGTRKALRAVLPSFAAVGNPVDVTGQIVQQPRVLTDVLPLLAADPWVDIVLVALGIVGPTYDIDAIVSDIAALHAEAATRGVLVAAASVGGRPDLGERLTARGVPTFDDDAACVRAVARFAEHCEWLRRTPPPAAAPLAVPLPEGAPPGFLSEHAGKALMAAWELPVVPGRLVPSPAAAARVDLGYPLVVKLCSPAAAHKTELGAVRLGLTHADAVERAAAEVLAAGRTAGVTPIEGVLVERMVRGGVEISLGATWDPVFGPTVLVGSGGVHVEVLRDFQLLIPPLDRAGVADALRALAIHPLLTGARGAEPLDVDALVDLVLRFSTHFAATGGALPEIDLNPVFVLRDGVVVADALVRVAGPDPEEA
ncbi:acetate--CoA ligase family protein [Pseudonocardia acidicola]|uniref:Acetate--CoA ligase family protein n=1 Tax=Pseudonocardia acidicola TaxID=2724939 RepID=A0ABX1SB45_9PSEU|nr:acetate--CoA ligase family protein [Pseudonocardia acidicola]NMH98770.1 acetate--CoA ligase family protein [Pseudonocardia acidicola]